MKGDDVADGLDELLLLKCEYPAGIRGGQDFGACGDCAACRGAKEIRRLRSELAELRAENDKLAYWNSAVAVCKDHVEEIVTATYGLCVLCDMDKLERELAELRGRGAGPVAGEGGVSEEPDGWLTSDADVGGEFFTRTQPAPRPGRTSRPLYAHPSVSAGLLEAAEKMVDAWRCSASEQTKRRNALRAAIARAHGTPTPAPTEPAK